MANIKNSNVKKLEADVVVVGGGGGGMVAAVKSAESGKKVILLEKTDSFGGASVMAGSICSVNSKLQVKAGTSQRLAEDLFSQIMNDTRWIPNPDTVRRFVYNTGPFTDWVNTKSPAFVKTFPEHRFIEWGRGSGFCEMISQFCNEKYGIKTYMETPATKLLRDKKGAVVGVLASSKNTDYEIHAKSVILSTGCFARNKKMLKKYFPGYFKNDFEFEFEGGPALSRFADGDGIKMAQEIGSMPDYHMDVLVGGGHHGSYATRRFHARPDVILVNKKGKRFMAEVIESGASRRWLAQPDAIAFTVFDSDSLEYFLHNPLAMRPDMPIKPPRPEAILETRERLKEENKAGNTKIANTLDEIAAYIGADPAVFKAEIKRFNTFCDKKHDEDYLKDPKYLRPVRKPPFYALLCDIWYQHTRGGIVVNENLEVLNKKGTPIKGLYATGDHSNGGWFSEFGYVVMTGLTWALVSGYMAADSSNDYIKSIS